MKHYRPDRKCLHALRLIISLITALLLAAVYYFITVRLLVVLLSAIIGSAAFFMMFAYLPLFISSIKYTATDTEILKTSGVFIKIHQSIKYSSIQYVTVVTTPLSQYTGLNFIIYFVYGGQLRLLFLDHEDAMEILQLSGIREEE